MPNCRRCLELTQEKKKANVYCTVTGMHSRNVIDCYLCNDCLAYMKKSNHLIKIFDPKEKPLTYPIKD